MKSDMIAVADVRRHGRDLLQVGVGVGFRDARVLLIAEVVHEMLDRAASSMLKYATLSTSPPVSAVPSSSSSGLRLTGPGSTARSCGRLRVAMRPAGAAAFETERLADLARIDRRQAEIAQPDVMAGQLDKQIVELARPSAFVGCVGRRDAAEVGEWAANPFRGDVGVVVVDVAHADPIFPVPWRVVGLRALPGVPIPSAMRSTSSSVRPSLLMFA